MSIVVEQLNYVYQPGTPWSVQALTDVNISIASGEAVAIVGGTGSGKSTLVQHFNGLLRPSSGRVLYQGEDIWQPRYDRRWLRQHIGLAFQFAEQQLFEATVKEDVAFGPLQLGVPKAEIAQRVEYALAAVGLPLTLQSMSPFSLSGGQMRRVALAGILALQPTVLILDEPTAGLDPAGRRELIRLMLDWHRQGDRTLIFISHNMDEVNQVAQRVIVMEDGQVFSDGPPAQTFSNGRALQRLGLGLPTLPRIMHSLQARGWDVRTNFTEVDAAADHIVAAAAKKDHA